MIKLQALENFTLERFNEIQDIERAGKEQKNWINKNDIFKCSKDLADYLLGDNPLKRPVVKVIEVEPEKEQWAVTKEEDGNVHVRPVVDGEIIDTPVEKVIKPKSSKKKKSSKK